MVVRGYFLGICTGCAPCLSERIRHPEVTEYRADDAAQELQRGLGRVLEQPRLALLAREFQQAYDQNAEHLAAEERRLAGLLEEQKRLEIHVEAAAQRLHELRQQDAQGLVSKEREARLHVDEAKRLYEQAKRRLAECRLRHEEADEALARARDALRKQAAAFGRQLQKLGRAMTFSTSALGAARFLTTSV